MRNIDPFTAMSGIRTNVEDFMLACDQVPSEQLAQLYIRLIKEEFGEFGVAIQTQDAAEALDAIGDLIWVLVGFSIAAKLPLNMAWREIYLTNMAKAFGPGGKIIRDTATGKILKPEGWAPPDMKRLISLYGRDNFIAPAPPAIPTSASGITTAEEAQMKLDLIERTIKRLPLSLTSGDVHAIVDAIKNYI